MTREDLERAEMTRQQLRKARPENQPDIRTFGKTTQPNKRQDQGQAADGNKTAPDKRQTRADGEKGSTSGAAARKENRKEEQQNKKR